MGLADHIGPWLPLIPGFGWLVIFTELNLSSVAVIGCIVLLYFGPNIIQQPILPFRALKADFETVDKSGQEDSYSQTLFIKSESATGHNTKTFELHWLSKIYSAYRGESFKSFTATAINFDIDHIPYGKGEGEFMGFPLKSGNIASVLLREIITSPRIDHHEKTPRYWMICLKKEARALEGSINV